MLKKITKSFLFIALLVVAGACSKYQKLIKSNDFEEKYKMAVVYYNKGDYYKAMQLFDAVIPFYRGTDKAEQLSYYYAYCNYHQGDHILASHFFKQFTKNYPSSKYAEECFFMNAYCKLLDSPVYSLDQTSTLEAINELQLFMDVFPNSERINECNRLIDELRGKLEKKEFEIAKMYLRMEDYQATITTFNNLLKDYPDTDYKEETLFNLVKAHFFFAMNSIETKKKERFQNVVVAYDTFVATFPDSDYLKQASSYYNSAQKQLLN